VFVYNLLHFNTVEELKQAITTEWKKLLQRFIDNSINEWRRRLECVVKEYPAEYSNSAI